MLLRVVFASWLMYREGVTLNDPNFTALGSGHSRARPLETPIALDLPLQPGSRRRPSSKASSGVYHQHQTHITVFLTSSQRGDPVSLDARLDIPSKETRPAAGKLLHCGMRWHLCCEDFPLVRPILVKARHADCLLPATTPKFLSKKSFYVSSKARSVAGRWP